MKDWMDHLNFLEKVALADVAHLKMKEATYQGSWKRSGGRSAWFMLRRKIDRMLEMLKKPEPPGSFNLGYLSERLTDYPDQEQTLTAAEVQFFLNTYTSEDIFLKIEEDPSGQDGSVLAEVRDLRRYLLLVEAEMVSRGVVEYPSKAIPVSSGPISGMDFAEAEKRVMAHYAENCGPGTKPSPTGRLEEGDTIVEVRTRVSDKHNPERYFDYYEAMSLREAQLRGYKPSDYTVLGSVPKGILNKELSSGPISSMDSVKYDFPGLHPGTPEDGGHHARQEFDEYTTDPVNQPENIR